ncbi:alanine racemase [Desulfurobacterium pacificum]|uniref:Alanine racemase n=1 Tax=Desulfurobacterium pacificum TaxID=240166 RepID=A0ABY1NGL5_9BACT|nr:alanine racemase [Desulfurobacterium pacificum]SMP09192.1 alanine racemase [Desulfurobacterium pacificum]
MLRWAEIHLDRLVENYKQIKNLSAGKKIIAVVKANAYGHGIKEVAQTLAKHTDVSAFAVATFDEAEELRNIGIARDILVMASPLSEGLDKIKELNAVPVIFDFEDLKLAKELKIPFHIKIDTGMGRLGFLENQWNKLLEELKGTNLKGIMTHFCCADEDKNFTEYQFKEFLSFFQKLKSLNFKNLTIHADNSSAIPFKLNKILTHSRVGIALYGTKPYENYPAELKQVMEVKAKVITTKELPANFPVSYSATYKTKQKEKVAVISFGYADGYLRSFSNKGYVLINDEKCPVRGRVCMDMTIVSSKTAKKGDTVTIFGEKITFEETAKVAGTISYELMCDISPRVKRIYFYPSQT